MFRRLKTMLFGLYQTKLPPQRYFSIDELLARWKSDDVTFQQICDWVEHENFVLGVRVRDTADISEQYQDEDGAVRTRTSRRMVLAGATERPPIRTDYLGADTLVKILTAPPGVKVEAPVTYSCVSRDRQTGTLHLSGGLYYDKAELVASLDEVQRIEKAFRIGRLAPMLSRWGRRRAHRLNSSFRLPTGAVVLTVVYVLAVALLAVIRKESLPSMELNAIGDFFAGASAPLTLLWLLAQFRQQAKVSAHAELDLLDSAKRQEESLKLLRMQAEAAVERLSIERERRKMETEPAVKLKLGTLIQRPGSSVTQEFELQNEGASTRHTQVFVKGIPGLDSELPLLDVPALEQGGRQLFRLTVNRDAKAAEGSINVVYTKADGKQEVSQVLLQLLAASSDSPTSLPSFKAPGL